MVDFSGSLFKDNSKAFAKITCRLVADQKPKEILKKIEKHVEKHKQKS